MTAARKRKQLLERLFFCGCEHDILMTCSGEYDKAAGQEDARMWRESRTDGRKYSGRMYPAEKERNMNQNMNAMKKNEAEKRAAEFIYRCARPLELARWQYHFEGGTREAVLCALAAYQNGDGGFGHALEADCFNPASAPIQTLTAVGILQEIGVTARMAESGTAGEIVRGILRYLESGADFSEEHGQWRNTVPGNNDFPHAVWWEYKPGEEQFEYNPTAGLTAFLLNFAEPDSEMYRRSCRLAVQAISWFLSKGMFEEQHVTSCFGQLYKSLRVRRDACPEGGQNGKQPGREGSAAEPAQEQLDALFPEFERLFFAQVRKNICADTNQWGGYVAMPSIFIESEENPLYGEFRGLLEKECEFILASQQPDGAFPVPWEWFTDYREFEIAKLWWRSVILLEKMLVLKKFCKDA